MVNEAIKVRGKQIGSTANLSDHLAYKDLTFNDIKTVEIFIRGTIEKNPQVQDLKKKIDIINKKIIMLNDGSLQMNKRKIKMNKVMMQNVIIHKTNKIRSCTTYVARISKVYNRLIFVESLDKIDIKYKAVFRIADQIAGEQLSYTEYMDPIISDIIEKTKVKITHKEIELKEVEFRIEFIRKLLYERQIQLREVKIKVKKIQ